MDVSENSGTPKSSISIGFSTINHPFWSTPIFGNTHISTYLEPVDVLYFLGLNAPKEGPNSIQNNGHLGSRYVYMRVS